MRCRARRDNRKIGARKLLPETIDEGLMRGRLHPDAVIVSLKPFSVDEFIKLGRAILGRYVGTWHNTGHQLVEVRGDVAWAEHHTTSSHRIAADDHGAGRGFRRVRPVYRSHERREGEWRIARRIMPLDFTRTDPVAPAAPGLGGRSGSRDRNDPS